MLPPCFEKMQYFKAESVHEAMVGCTVSTVGKQGEICIAVQNSLPQCHLFIPFRTTSQMVSLKYKVGFPSVQLLRRWLQRQTQGYTQWVIANTVSQVDREWNCRGYHVLIVLSSSIHLRLSLLLCNLPLSFLARLALLQPLATYYWFAWSIPAPCYSHVIKLEIIMDRNKVSRMQLHGYTIWYF